MPGKVSFYYAVFKKFQVSTATLDGYYGHLDDDDSEDLAGGFSLRHPDHKYGMFGTLGPNASDFNLAFGIDLQPGLTPLNPNSLVPAENPLYAVLAASLAASPPQTVTIDGKKWPVMPMFPTDPWTNFNSGSFKLIDAFANWIIDGKVNDTPKKATLAYDYLAANPPKLWPGLTDHNKPGFVATPLLFVASMPNDDGRRHGDHGSPDVPVDHVPANFWDTSQIFLSDEKGNTKYPAKLKAGEEYYVNALIGNCGNWGAGSAGNPNTHFHVRCDAMAFNTVLSPGTALPSLDNLDPAATGTTYEQFYLRAERWDVAGFRFNVDSVFDKLKTALAGSNIDLGGNTPAEWLNESHACVKVRIMQGEQDNIFKPEGNDPLTLSSSPRKDRHIAQRNLAPFEVTMAGAKQLKWTRFIVAQVGKGANTLVLQHGLPLDAFSLYLAVTRSAYERFVAAGSRGGGRIAGFEPVRESRDLPKPFPEAVMLRQTGNDKEGATYLEIAAHDREPYLGMALGIGWDPAHRRPSRLGDVAMIHHGADHAVMGGFTLRLVPARRRPPR